MFDQNPELWVQYAGLLLVAFICLGWFICRRRSTKKLHEQTIFLQTLINSMPNPVFYKNRQGIYIGCNEAFLTMLGRRRDEVLGKTVYDLSPHSLAEIYEKADNDLFEKGGVQRYETQVKFADGSRHEMFFSKAIFDDLGGRGAGLLGVMIDITDRKNMEEALKKAHSELEHRVEERTAELAETNRQLGEEIVERQAAERESRVKSEFLDTIINSISHGLVVIDANDYSIKLANTAAANGELDRTRHCFDFLHGSTGPCSGKDDHCPVRTVKRTGKPVIVQHEHHNFGGSSQHVEIHAYPVFDENHKVVQVIENIMDITARKQAEEAMVEAKDMAETTSRLMSEFLVTVSHELRTPMTSVHGFAKLIDKNFDSHFEALAEDDPKLRKKAKRIKGNLDIIISESERLTSLINDHLDLSKLESGRIEWNKEVVPPLSLVERVEAATRALFDDPQLTFQMNVEEGLPDVVVDPDRILQVLINLVSNSVKFTDEGTIICGVRRQGDSILFSVVDTGIGIPEDQLEAVFSMFSQIQTKKDGKPSGTGLGLAISRKIIDHHRGRIWAESRFGEGSTFSFIIPLGE